MLACPEVPSADQNCDACPVRLVVHKAHDPRWIRDYLAAEIIGSVITQRGYDPEAAVDFDRER